MNPIEKQVRQWSGVWAKRAENGRKVRKMISDMVAELKEKDALNDIPLRPWPYYNVRHMHSDAGRADLPAYDDPSRIYQ